MGVARIQGPRTRLLGSGVLVLLAWIGVLWVFWLAHCDRPRQSVPLAVPNPIFPTVPAGSPITLISPQQDELAFVNPATGEKEVMLKANLTGVWAIITSRDRKRIATFNEDGTKTVWRVGMNGQAVPFPFPRQASSYGVVSSPDGKMAAMGRGAQVRVWDTASQREIATFDGILACSQGEAFFPDNSTLATLTVDGIKLWDLATHGLRRTLAGQFDQFAIAPDGLSVATCDANNRVSFWDVSTGQERATFHVPSHVSVSAMFFSSGGSKICLAGFSGDAWIGELLGWLGLPHPTSRLGEAAMVFDSATGKECARISDFAFPVLFADETTLAALSKAKDGIQLWDLPPRTALHPFFAWACLGGAILLTGACCHAWRASWRSKRAIHGQP